MSVGEAGAARASVGSATDRRKSAHGLGRIVIAVFWLFSAWVTYTAVSDYIHFPNEPMGPRLVSVLAAAGYIAAATALTHNGRRMRIVGWSATGFELAGALITGFVGIGVEEIGAIRSVWGNFGSAYYYIPLVLPLLGFIWLWWSNPRRIVEISERLEF